MSMSLIDEIRAARVSQLTEEHKEKLLAYIKKNLMQHDNVVIGGAAHFSHDWKIPDPDSKDWWKDCYAPYKLHPAITDWLISLGFTCSRYYNRGGVDQGICVRI